MYLILKWVLFALALIFTAWIVPGITVANFLAALFVVVIIALINLSIRPLILAITLPINFLTLGLFTFVINALLLMLAGWIAPGFSVDGFWSAFLGSLILSILGALINMIDNKKAP